MTDVRARLSSPAGFSLVEMLVVMVLAGIIGGAVVTAVVSAGRAERVAVDLRENTDAARIATERLRDEIRTAWGVCDGSTGDAVSIWWADEDEDGTVDPEELRTFEITDGQLVRTVPGEDPQVLARGLGPGSGFSYVDRHGQAVPAPVDDRAVDCTSAATVEGRGDVTGVRVVLLGAPATDRQVQPTRVEMVITMRNAAVTDGPLSANRAPTASFTQSCSGLQCTFDASESHDEDGDIVAYQWDFGDGTSGDGETVSNTYPTAGSFEVTLTVLDDGGAPDVMTQFVDLSHGQAAPSAAFSVTCSQMECAFDPSASTHSTGTIAGYGWEFGDGATVSTTTSQTVSHEYDEPGVYSVTLTVTDTQGAIGTQNHPANPTTDPDGIVITLVDESYLRSNGKHWYPTVRVEAQYPDGAPVTGVEIRGRFGPGSGDLESQPTNSLGFATLQGDRLNRNQHPSYQFRVTSAGSYDIADGSQLVISLQQPS